MASLKYTVDVDTKGARSSISSLEKSLGGLGAAVAGGFAVGNLVAFGDSIIGLQNKLRSLTSDQGLAASMFDDIARVAGAARAPLQETGDLYFRIARAAKDLGISQQQTSDITESLAKSMSMTGATAQETSGALLQLGQALQSGRFAGDELRSVLENMPIVSKAMADELGVTIGELRKLGSEGKITSDVFVRAMEKNKKAIDDAFARSIPTATQALNNLKTAFGIALNEMATEEGPSKLLADLGAAILSLSKDIPALVEAIKSLVTVLGFLGIAFAAFKGIALIRTGLNALSKAFILASVSSTGFFTKITANFAGIYKSMRAVVSGAGQITAGVKKLGGTVTFMVRLRQVFFSLAAIAGNLLRVLLRFAGWIGIALAIAEAVDYLVKKFFGFSIVDWAISKVSALWATLKGFAASLGLIDKQVTKGGRGGGREPVGGPNRAVTDAFDASRSGKKNDVFGDASTKVSPKMDDGGAKKTAKDYADALRDVKKAINEVTAAFRESSAARIDDLKFQLQSMTMSEDQVELETKRRDIIKEQKTALADLAAKQIEINESEDLSKKGKVEALALVAQQIVSVNELAAAELASSEATLKAMQAKNLAFDEQLKKTELLQKANENRATLTALEDQLKLVGLYGDKLDEVTAQIELQQKLREIEVDFQNQLLELEDKKLKLGEKRYAMELAMLNQGKAQAIAAANAVGAAQKKVDDAKKKSERNDIGAAFGKRFEELERSVDPAVTALQGLDSLFNNMGNALDNFVDTGKFKFGDFAKSVIADIAKIALKATVTKLFTLIGKSLLGGLAAGGPAMANKPYLVGEQGPELFVPNSAGSIMTNASMNKNAGLGEGGGGTVNNTYITNNISAIDSRSVAQMFVENRKSLLGASMMARKELPYGG